MDFRPVGGERMSDEINRLQSMIVKLHSMLDEDDAYNWAVKNISQEDIMEWFNTEASE